MGGGEQIQWLLMLSKEQGYPVRALAEAPVLFRYLEPVMEAFNMLSSARQLGAFGGCGPISLLDIITYLNWYGITNKDEQERWIKQIRGLDNFFIKYQSEQAKRT